MAGRSCDGRLYGRFVEPLLSGPAYARPDAGIEPATGAPMGTQRGRAGCRWGAWGAAAVLTAAAAPARADNLGAIGKAYGFLLVLAIAAALLLIALVAGVASRRSAPRRRWKLPFAVVGLLACIPSVVIAYDTAPALFDGPDAVFGLVLPFVVLVTLIACLNLLRRNWPARWRRT